MFTAFLECYKMFHLSKFYGINTILQYSNQKNYFKYRKSSTSRFVQCLRSQAAEVIYPLGQETLMHSSDKFPLIKDCG